MADAELHHSQLIDLTTTGRRTHEPRRIEIYLHDLDGQLFITGMPSPGHTRAWLHNVEAEPEVTIHLKESALRDVPATARVVTDPDERLPLIQEAARRWRRDDIDVMMQHSPLMVLTAASEARPSASARPEPPRS